VKLFCELDQDEACEIKKLMNLTHRCIAAPLEFGLPTAAKELKIAKLYTRSDSRKDIRSGRLL
jgi:hypothetical protein